MKHRSFRHVLLTFTVVFFLSVCFDMYVYVGFFSVNHRIVYLYVWFVSMCLCCIRPNKNDVVKKKEKKKNL